MNRRCRILAGIPVILLSTVACAGAGRQGLHSDHSALAIDRVTIGGPSIHVPASFITLIRRGPDLCAIRFVDIRRGYDSRDSTAFSTGAETKYAAYEWNHQADGSADFARETATSGRRELLSRALVGVGRLAFQTGTTTIKCGPFELGWIYPTGIGLEQGRQSRDYSVEVAPTKWTEIGQVNAGDSRLKWYRGQDERRNVELRVGDLW